MKFTAGVIAALASCATAATATGQAFTFPRDESVSTASLGRSLARLVFLQRLGSPGRGPTIGDIPDDISADDAVETLNRYGASGVALFTADPATTPKRLLVMIDGMSEEQIKDAGKALGQRAAFTIDDLPSSAANHDLFDIDVYNAGATKQHSCSLGEIVQMTDNKCWGESSTAARYNVAKNEKSMAEILGALRTIPVLANAGKIEATVVLLPETSANAKPSWSDKPQELRRRQAEQIISSHNKAASSSISHAPASASTPAPLLKQIPSCFSSQESCIKATGNCSSESGSQQNGLCINKYGDVPENPKEGDVCFVCRCREGKGGPACSKQDISAPFWLFFGFTVVIVSVLWMAISLLFSVGEEKLPGVIGAGVSRSK